MKKKSPDLLGLKKNHPTSQDKNKITRTLGTKKITQPLRTKKIPQPLQNKIQEIGTDHLGLVFLNATQYSADYNQDIKYGAV